MRLARILIFSRMTFNGPAHRLIAPVEQSIDAWYNLEGNGRATWILLALFVLAWTTFHTLAFASIDLHPDLTEIYAWSRHPSAGYYKHPPLPALVAGVWFAVFPVADWSMHLLAIATSALGLFAVDLIARRYLSGDKRLLALLLLLLTPFYQFHGQRFNANQVLLWAWPLATYCFLRAFETRAIVWAIAAGVAAAVAMLGKYYSIFLVAALVVAALAHPARWTYFRSPSPWVSAIAAIVTLAPHLHWLVTTGSEPFKYAYAVHGEASLMRLVAGSASYLFGAVGYVALPIAIYVLAVRPDRRTLADALWPVDQDRRMLVVLLAVMILLPALSAPFLGLLVSSLWSMEAWFLLPIVLLAPNTVVLPRWNAVRVALFVLVLTAVMLVAAPLIAWTRHTRDDQQGRSFYRLVSDEIMREWRRHTDRPLTIVMGDLNTVPAVSFYSPDHPDSVPDFVLRVIPWVTGERLKREGWAMVCRLDDVGCVAEAVRRSSAEPQARRSDIEVARRYLGGFEKSERFILIIVPPNLSPSSTRERPT